MSANVQHTAANRPGNRNHRSVEEDFAWLALYRDICQASTAEEVVKYLDKNEVTRNEHFALYLRAKNTIRKTKEAKERHKRVGSFLRLVVVNCLIAPVVASWKAIKWTYFEGRDIAVEALPPTAVSPAVFRINELRKDPEVAPAIDGLDSKARSSRRTKTA